MNKNGFSLIEIVFTIIIIGLVMGAITESFIAGSAKSVNIVNEETAVNVAKGITAELNYCRNGGTVTVGTPPSVVCSAFNNAGSIQHCKDNPNNTWCNPSSFYTSPPGPPKLTGNECFYTMIAASNVDFNDTGGNGKIQNTSPPNSPSDFIQTIVQTGWFASNAGGNCPTPPTGCPGTPGSCPYITLSTVYANY